jgi:hypothetical protein
MLVTEDFDSEITISKLCSKCRKESTVMFTFRMGPKQIEGKPKQITLCEECFDLAVKAYKQGFKDKKFYFLVQEYSIVENKDVQE